ncbi:hypothetical protein AB840_04180 [Megasphaera cerevisiae DSM 20462]|uniref:DUF2577 domain-containing protein n=1 Tax=Megasphaera cerevisiae DSM 20462 TaxID=1122219 RepID=A0A0J6WYB1_9FIRM|nr:DUF2577 domain-containing protein [Megasphaera cerevisiae]KMO87233.1 hypothetical protein AB840_04180 [Megasphaera cerevisiae DSM 20462]SJZ61311.1 Protein of unknown function [Megasphaera cerevisiae DSM 20462]
MGTKNTPTAAQSMANMVHTMHGIAQEERPQGTMIGIVTAPPPDIKVMVNNIELTKEDVYISEYLLIGYQRTGKGHIVSATQNRGGGSGDAAYESHNHDINNDYTDTIIYTDTLKVGDRVSVIPVYGQDAQLYIIEDKVVKL